jgi:hypothetical protein
VSGALAHRALATALALAVAVSCQPTSPKLVATADVEGAPKLAHAAGAILLQFSAYNYGLAGALSGERNRTVAPARYGTVARGAAKSISAFNAGVLGGTIDHVGPLRDKLVPLADGLADLGRDGEAYADVGDPAAFARIISGVSAGWQRLRDLSTALPKDDALQSTIARGSSFVVTAKAATRSTVTAGPYATAGEAQQALRKMGSPLNATITQVAPFIVRIGPYPDRASAEAVQMTLTGLGITSLVTDEQSYSFARSGAAPDAELWREPSRVQDTHATSRRLALSDDGTWILTGGDDGFASLFSPSGTLRGLPEAVAGLSVLGISDDARFWVTGGQTLVFRAMPSGEFPEGGPVGAPMRLTGAATQLIFVQTTRAFLAVSKGPTGDGSGGAGIIGGRAPDGEFLGAPFPIETPAAGAQLAASEPGDVYIGTNSGGAYDIATFRPGRDPQLRALVRITGSGRALAIDRAGAFGAAVTDKGTFRFNVADPRSVTRIADPVRDIGFTPDGTLYLLDQSKLTAIGKDGAVSWTAPLIDGRRLVAANRAVVLDGTDRLLAFAPGDGTADELGAGGTITDITMSHDGRVVGAIVDARRAVLFTLP